MRSRIPAVLATASLLFMAISAHAAQKNFDRTFKVQPGGLLSIVADSADVTVTGSEAKEVSVRIVATGSDGVLEKLTLGAEQTAAGVAVTAQSPGGVDHWLRRGPSTQITVRVPHRYGVDVKTSGGDLELRALEGKANGTTSGGDIRFSEVRGPVRMRTSGGDISIGRVQGDVVANTSGGDIEADAVTGAIDVHTSGGSITLAKIDGAISAKTSGGRVHAALTGANRGISASSSGGSIVIEVPVGTRGMLDAATSGGSVDSDIPVSTTSSSSGKLQGAINGGGERIYARTSGGSIRLRAVGTQSVEGQGI